MGNVIHLPQLHTTTSDLERAITHIDTRKAVYVDTHVCMNCAKRFTLSELRQSKLDGVHLHIACPNCGSDYRIS